LDVSVKETSVCIVDDTGRIVREVKVASAAHAGGSLTGINSMNLEDRLGYVETDLS